MCERNTDWLPLTHPQLGTWLATQACALTGNITPDLSVCRTTPNPLTHPTGATITIFGREERMLQLNPFQSSNTESLKQRGCLQNAC